MLKKIGLGILVLSFVFVMGGANLASADLTLGALSVASSGAYTVTGAVGSAMNFATTTTTGAINIGTALVSGALTIGKNDMTSAVTIFGGTTTGANSLFDNTTTSNTTILAGQTSGTLSIGGTAGLGAISIGASTGAQAINIGTGNAVKTIVIGNSTAGGASITTIHAGTGGLNLATTADARTIAIGTGAAIQTWNIGTGNAVQTVHLADNASPANAITIGGAASTTTVGGTLTSSSRFIKSVNTALTALAGGAQAGTALTKDINFVTTVATTADSVQLPVAVVGMDITIINRAANSLNVFGQTGDGINAGGANAAYAVATLVEARCIAVATSGATAWECQKLAR